MTTTKKLDLPALAKVRTATRGILGLGLAASLAANIVASEPTAVGRIVAAWPPVALMLTIELLSRVPGSGGWLSRLRVLAAGSIAAIAAWVSYWHMVDVALTAGEEPIAAHLIPLAVDGLVIVASVSLVEVGAELANVQPAPPQERAATRRTPAPDVAERSTSAQAQGKERSGTGVAAARQLLAESPDLTHKEIADRLGVSTKTVSRAAAALKSEEQSLALKNGVSA